jgi:hypothetical protein
MASLASPTCYLCHETIVGEGHFGPNDPAVDTELGDSRICDDCHNALIERGRGADARLVAVFKKCGDKRLLPGYKPMSLPLGYTKRKLDAKRLSMYKHVVQYARSKGLVVEFIDKRVHTSEEWQQWCCTYARANPNKVLMLKWDFTKPWCIYRTNFELAVGNNEILSCHWVTYHRDSFLRMCMVQPLDICKDDFERFIQRIHASRGDTENCAVCMEKKLSERFCNTCHNSVCYTCAKKIANSRNKTCPFCRSDFLSPEARELIRAAIPSADATSVPKPRAYPLRAQMSDGTVVGECHNDDALFAFMGQVGNKVIETGEKVFVFIIEQGWTTSEAFQYCVGSLHMGTTKVALAFHAANSIYE